MWPSLKKIKFQEDKYININMNISDKINANCFDDIKHTKFELN